ncbi:hypothetical protein FF2_037719 [Malus domestica]
MRMNKNNNQVVLETQGHWKIQKRLAASDLGYCARLLIPIDSVRNHVLPYLGDKFVKRLESEAGFEVIGTIYWASSLGLILKPMIYVKGEGALIL